MKNNMKIDDGFHDRAIVKAWYILRLAVALPPSRLQDFPLTSVGGGVLYLELPTKRGWEREPRAGIAD